MKIQSVNGITEYICNIEGTATRSIKDYLSHKSIHQREHIPPMRFDWWLGRMTNVFVTDMQSQFDQSTIDKFYVLYKEYLKGTCANMPCYSCIQRNIIRTMPEKKYMKYKLEKDGQYELDKNNRVKREYPQLNYTPYSLNTGEPLG